MSDVGSRFTDPFRDFAVWDLFKFEERPNDLTAVHKTSPRDFRPRFVPVGLAQVTGRAILESGLAQSPCKTVGDPLPEVIDPKG